MSQKGRMNIKFVSGAFTAMTVLFIGCASNTGQWESELLFKKDAIAHNKLTTGNSVLLFPLIREKAFDTSTALAPEEVVTPIRKQQADIEVLFKRDFEKAYCVNNSRESLDSFYVRLFENDVLAIATSDSAWKYMPSRFVILVRVDKGVRISSFDGVTKKKAVLEGEIWDSKSSEVVWRARTSGFDMDKKTDDAQFIANGIKEIFKLLPEFIPLKEVENW